MKKKALLDAIERWLANIPTQPHIEHMTATDASGAVVEIVPTVIEVINKEAMMAEWEHFVRPDIEAS